MSTTPAAPVLTAAQKITAAFHESERIILPARLMNVPANTFAIMSYVSAKALDPASPDSYIATFNAIYRQLDWAVKPAKLLADERNNENKPATSENVRVSETKRTELIRAGEKADAKVKAEAASEKATLELISGFLPINKRGQVDYAKQTEVQTRLRKYLDQQKAKGSSMKATHAAVYAEIQRQYAASERANERV